MSTIRLALPAAALLALGACGNSTGDRAVTGGAIGAAGGAAVGAVTDAGVGEGAAVGAAAGAATGALTDSDTVDLGERRVELEQRFRFDVSDTPRAEIYNSVRGGWAPVPVRVETT